MEEKIPDRRKHHAFRFLYMDFKAFWERIILGKKAPPTSAAKPKAPSPTKKRLTEETDVKPSPTGIRKIDEQHHGVRDAILKLQKGLRDSSLHQPLPEALDALLQLMNEHFRYEEAYLEHIHFPDLESHRAEHDQFRSQVLLFRERAETEDSTVPLELSSFLFNWFRQHTLQEEAAFTKLPRTR